MIPAGDDTTNTGYQLKQTTCLITYCGLVSYLEEGFPMKMGL